MGDRYAQPQQLKGVPKEVILYQYEVCPFCCKVKAFLDYHKVPHPCSPPADSATDSLGALPSSTPLGAVACVWAVHASIGSACVTLSGHCMPLLMPFAQIPYRTVEVSPLTKEQLKWSDYRKVPVALLDGEQVVDSTAIITRLAAELDAQEHPGEALQQRARQSWLSFRLGRQPEAVSPPVAALWARSPMTSLRASFVHSV